MEKGNIHRKLAAIVFTDIVGFTALSAIDEQKAFKLLDKQRILLKPIVDEYDGDWLKEMGDGLLLTFPTVSGAVKCAIKIQETVKKETDINLRIGIHEGEITVKDGDVFGDDVNIASRIEPFSATGGIAISGKVQQNISSLPEYKTKFIGIPKLKGVAQKVEVHCIISHSLPETKISDVNAKLEAPKTSKTKKVIISLTGMFFTLIGVFVWFILPILTFSTADENTRNFDKKISVLFFQSIGNPSQEIYADGLTEEVINRLTRVDNLSVSPKMEVIKYKNNPLNIDEIIKELNTNYIVAGTLTKNNGNFKASVELIDTENKDLLWSDNIVKKDIELFAIQDDIVNNIMNNIDLKVSKLDKDQIAINPSSDLEAYELLLKLKQESYKATSSTSSSDAFIDSMIISLESILEKDPEYADALATLSMYEYLKYFFQGYWNNLEKLDEAKAIIDQSIQHSELAIKYDPLNQLAHINLPFAHILKLWICNTTSSKIFTGRKAMIALNEQMNKFPDHYTTNVVKGFYHRLRCRFSVLTQDNDYNDAVKFMALGIDQMQDALNKNMVDPFINILYKESLKGLATFVDTYHDYSLALNYYPDYIEYCKDNIMYEDALWAIERQSNIKLLTGRYDEAMDDLYRAESIARREKLKKKWLSINLYISEIYNIQGQSEIAIELLNEIKNDIKLNHDDKNLVASFHKILGNTYYSNGQIEKALNEFKLALNEYDGILENVSSSFTKWIINGKIMDIKSKMMLTNIELDKDDIAKTILIEIEEILNNESRIYFEYSISSPYEIATFYKLNGDNNKYIEYLNTSYDEFLRIEDILDAEDKKFFNDIEVHKKIKEEKVQI